MRAIGWRASGEPNFYTILADNNKWFGVVQLNGEMTVEQQKIYMTRIINAINQIANPNVDSFRKECEFRRGDPGHPDNDMGM